MKKLQRFGLAALAAAILIGATGCSGMSTRDRNMAIGAGVGAIGGAALTDGSALGTIGGAAAGGLIGNQIR